MLLWGESMDKRPIIVYLMVLLWLALSVIFVLWGSFSLTIVLQIPEWITLGALQPQLYVGYLLSTIIWFLFSSLFLIFAYGTFRGDNWVWSTSLIISTIFLVAFSLMLAAFMVNALTFYDWFSIMGLVTVVLAFIIDLGVIFFLTRPLSKLYFKTTE
jgi:hypothetical protein